MLAELLVPHALSDCRVAAVVPHPFTQPSTPHSQPALQSPVTHPPACSLQGQAHSSGRAGSSPPDSGVSSPPGGEGVGSGGPPREVVPWHCTDGAIMEHIRALDPTGGCCNSLMFLLLLRCDVVPECLPCVPPASSVLLMAPRGSTHGQQPTYVRAGVGMGSPLGVKLLRRLLSWEPSARPTAAQALRHVFFVGGVGHTYFTTPPAAGTTRATGSGGEEGAG